MRRRKPSRRRGRREPRTRALQWRRAQGVRRGPPRPPRGRSRRTPNNDPARRARVDGVGGPGQHALRHARRRSPRGCQRAGARPRRRAASKRAPKRKPNGERALRQRILSQEIDEAELDQRSAGERHRVARPGVEKLLHEIERQMHARPGAREWSLKGHHAERRRAPALARRGQSDEKKISRLERPKLGKPAQRPCRAILPRTVNDLCLVGPFQPFEVPPRAQPPLPRATGGRAEALAPRGR